VDLKDLEELIDLFERKKIAELEFEKSGVRVHLKKNLHAETVSMPFPWPAFPSAGSAAGAKGELDAANGKGNPAAMASSQNVVTVTSPIVGTFYRAPSPEAQSFVQEGDLVEKGQVLCIVEAMKLMNEIEAECAGKILSALVENGSPVEYGQVLFLIEPL